MVYERWFPGTFLDNRKTGSEGPRCPSYLQMLQTHVFILHLFSTWAAMHDYLFLSLWDVGMESLFATFWCCACGCFSFVFPTCAVVQHAKKKVESFYYKNELDQTHLLWILFWQLRNITQPLFSHHHPERLSNTLSRKPWGAKYPRIFFLRDIWRSLICRMSYFSANAISNFLPPHPPWRSPPLLTPVIYRV
jgi:hypothetical protein